MASAILSREGMVLSESQRGEAVALAAATGQDPCLGLLLSDGPILQSARDAAFIVASRFGHLSCAMAIEEGAQLSPNTRLKAGVRAAENGSAENLSHLLETHEFSWLEKSRILTAAQVHNRESCSKLMHEDLRQNAALSL